MQKKLQFLLFCLALIAVPWATQAQDVRDYRVATGVDNSTWITLSSSAQHISSIEGEDDATSGLINIGFPFTFGGTSYTQFSCNSNGRMRLGSVCSNYWVQPFTTLTDASYNDLPFITAFGMDNTLEASGSYVKYELTGTTPNRILVVEYCTPSTYDPDGDLVRYQIQLMEDSNRVRFVYDSVSASYYGSYQAGIAAAADDFLMINTSTHTSFTTGTSTTFSSWPGTGRYYQFTPGEPANCPAIRNLMVSNVSSGYASLSWSPRDGTISVPTGYEVVCRPTDGSSAAVTLNTTAPSITISGLTAGTTYIAAVRAVCGTDYGMMDSITFETNNLPCVSFTNNTADTVIFSNGTSTYSGVLVYSSWGNTMYQTVYTAAELTAAGLTAGGILGVDFGFASNSSYAKEFSIYMGQSNRSSFSSATDYVDPSTLQLMYGPTSHPLNTSGWQHYNFSQPFVWDGVSNIVVCTFMNQPTGTSQSSSGFSGYYTNAHTGASLYRYKDGTQFTLSNYTTSSGGSTTSYRASIHFYAAECLQTATCTAPSTWIDSVGSDMLTVSWLPGYQETSWDVQYRVHGTSAWTTAATGDTLTTFTFTGLTPATHYDVRVLTICGTDTFASLLNTTTLCVPVTHTSLPFTYGFEDLTNTGIGYPLAMCWDRGYWTGVYNASSYPYANTTAHTGSRSLYFYGYGPTTCSWLSLPMFEDSLNNLRLQFWAKKSSLSYSGMIVLGTMTDPEVVSTFQPMDTLVTDASTDWNHFETTLGNAPATGRLTLMVVGGSSSMTNYMYLDDITVDEIPFCTTPVVDSIVVTEATASFYLSEIENASAVSLTVSAGSWNTTITGSSSPLVVTNLAPRVRFNYTLSAACGTDASNSRTGTFCSECTPVAHDDLPYTNGFEDLTTTGSGSLLAPCWDRGYLSGSSYNGMSYPYAYATAHTGSRALYFYGYSTTTHSWLCLPEFEDSINTLQLEFWAKATSSSYSGDMVVGVMTDPTDLATFQPVFNVSANGSTDWVNFNLPMNNAPGTGRLTIMVPGFQSTSNYVYIDDITVSEVPACPHVTNLHMDSAGVDWANISWTSLGNADSWVMEYDTVDFVPGTSTAQFSAITMDTTYLIEFLDTGTTYYLYLRSDCSGDTSTYERLVFSTIFPPATVPYFCTFERNGNQGWQFANGSQTNYWTIGNGAGNGSTRSMYITNDGATNSYTISSTSNVYAYQTFALTDTGEYVYSFNWKAYGESCCDYGRVALMPITFSPTAGNSTGWAQSSGTAVSGAVADLTGNNRLNVSSSWNTQTGTFHLDQPGFYQLVFFWHNDGSVGTQPPLSVDNVQLAYNSCPLPTNLTASNVGSTDVSLSWTAGGSEGSWVVSNGFTEDYTSSNSYTFTGLQPNTQYVFSVRAICSADDTSMAATLSVTTECGALSSFPFVENFENVATGGSTTANSNFIRCWYHLNNATTYYGYPYVSTSHNHTSNGTKGLYWYATTTATTYGDYYYVVLPAIDTDVVSVNSMRMSFWAKATSTSYHPVFDVGLMTDPTDVTTFTVHNTIAVNPGSSTNWAKFTTEFDDYTGNGSYIAIRALRPTSVWYAAVDDIVVDQIPDCHEVSNIAASNITNSTADLTWRENGDAYTWNIEYGVSGFELGTGTSESVSSLPHTLTGLTANTVYDVYITPSCSGVAATASYSFRTECDLMTSLPYSYGFENEATSSSTAHPVINCWHHLNNGSQYYGYPYVSSTAHNGSRSLYWYTSTTTGTYGDYQIVVLPGVDEATYPINTLQLSFWARSTSSSYFPVFQVGVMTDPNNAATFQPVASVNVDNSTQWHEYSASLGSYMGSGQYVAVRALRSGWYAYTDDFTLAVAPACPAVENVETPQVGTTGALVTWSLTPGTTTIPDEYEIRVTPTGNTSTTLTYTSTQPRFLVTGLTPNTDYDVQVRANCDADGYGAWSAAHTFSTQATPCRVRDTNATQPLTLTGPVTNNNYFIPLNNFYNYTLTQQLVMASELGGPTMVRGIDFYYSYSTATVEKTNCTIYLANTSAASLSSGFVPYSASAYTPVYTGSMNCTTGWNHFQFTTPFYYNGSGNLLITVHDNSGAYDGSSYTFRGHQVGSGISRHLYNDGDAYALSELSGTAGNSYDYRSDMQLYIDGCLEADSCAAPLVVVDSTSPDMVSISWAAGLNEDSWQIDYRQGNGSWQSEGTVYTTAYTFTNLSPSTRYTFRVTAPCPDSTSMYTTVQVTTPCLPTPVPFHENFESFSTSTSDPLPTCWAKYTNYSTSYPYASTSYNHSSGGNRSMYMYSTNTTYSYMVLPIFDIPIDSTTIVFWLYKNNTSYANNLSVGVMTDPADLSTYTEVAQATPTQYSVWEPFEINFNTYNGTGRYIAIMSPNGVYSYPYLDDLEVNRISSCPRVNNVVATAITGNSATITWSNTTASDYEVEYGPAGFTLGNGTLIPVYADNTVTLTGLNASSAYDVYVRGICDDETGNWSFVYTFYTECGAITHLPYTENFESAPTGSSTLSSFIYCWTHLNNGSSYYGYPYISSSTAYNHTPSGSKGLYWYNTTTTGSYGDYQIVAMPAVDTDLYPLNTLRYKFWAKSSSTSYHIVFHVGVMTDPNDPDSFTPVDTIDINGNTAWQEFTTLFDSYTGYGSYVALRALRPTSSWYAYVDDISLSVIPDCEGVSDFEVVYINTTDATLTWTENGAATSWDVEYGPSGFAPGSGTTATAAALPFSIYGLTPATSYDIYITPTCSGNAPETLMFTFRTECNYLDSLPYVETFEDRPTGSSTSTAFIECWHRLNNGTDYFGYPYVASSDSYNHTYGGAKGLYWYNTTTSGTYGDYQIIVLPPVDTNTYPINTLEVSFWAKSSSTSYNPVFHVGIMANPYDASDSLFEVLDTVYVSNSTQWSQYTVGLGQHVGPGCHVAIRAQRNSASWYAYVDDISLEILPDCPRVEDLAASSVTVNSALISWTDTSSSNTSWYIEYDTVNFTPGTGAIAPIPVTDTFYAMTGLDTGTTYHVYVYPDCDGTIAERYLRFDTRGGVPAEIPFYCDFEGPRNNGFDNYNGTQTNAWYIGTATNNGGNKSLYISNNDGESNAYSIASTSNVFAVRDIHIADTGEYVISYDWNVNGEQCCDYVRVALMPESFTIFPNQANSFATGSSMPAGAIILDNGDRLNQSSGWQQYVQVFNMNDTGIYRLVFFWHNDGSVGTQPPAAIDNIALAYNRCAMPTNVVANTFADSIQLSWSASTNSIEWIVTCDTASVTTLTPNYTFTGLTPNTDYTVTIRAICVEGDSSFTYSSTLHTPCVAITLPYFENFDALPTSTYPPCWQYIMTGSSTYQTGSYLPKVYSSSTYAHSGSNTLWLYGVGYFMLPPVEVPLDSVQLTFWHYTTSTSYGLEVGVMEGNNFVPIQTISSPISTHLMYTVYFGEYTGNSRTIAFRNYYTSSSTTYYSYHYLDDINVDYVPTCPPVYNIHALSASETSINVDWSDLGSPTHWEIEYGPADYTFGSSAGTRTVVSSHPTTVTGLDTLSYYDFYIRPICSATDTGAWSALPAQLSTGMCANAEMAYSYDSTMSSSTTSYAPIGYSYYNYSYVQTIVDSAMLASLSSPDIVAFAFNPTNATAGDQFNHITVYLANVRESNLSAGFILPDSTHQFVEVITDRNLSYSSAGWKIHGFDSTFTWDGHSNLLVAVNRLNGSYVTGATFASHSTTATKTRYLYQDSGPYSITNPTGGTSGTVSGVGDMMFYSCAGDVCRQPIITAVNKDYHSATLTWTGTGTDYQVNIKQSTDLNWTNPDIDVSGNSYTFTGLLPATNYVLRVRANCSADSLGYSDWVEAPFVTDSLPCLVPDSLHATAVTNATATLDWNVLGNETNWDIHVWFTGGLDSVYRVSSHPATVGGFTAGLTYYAAVRPLCGIDLLEGDWSDTVSFTTATCPDVTGLTASNVTTNSVTLNWTANPMALSWTIEYGFEGFNQGSGTTVTANTNSYVVTGLLDESSYEFFVKANCGTDWTSENWVSVQATTQSGGVVCDAPTGISTTVADNAVTVNWTPGTGNISYEIEYGPRGFSHGNGTVTNATSSPAVISNLDYETSYDLYVRAICDQNTYSAYSIVATFTTGQRPSEDCAPVSNLAVTEITDNTAHVAWTPAEGTDTWQIVVTDAQGSDVVDEVRSESHFDLAGLTAGKDYTVRVRTVCGDDNFSAYVSANFRTTGGVGIGDVNTVSCTIYPNPTTSSTTISVSGINGKVKIEVVDMNGRVVSSDNLECSSDCAKTMDVDNLAQGAYFVRVTADSVNMVRKLIVR